MIRPFCETDVRGTDGLGVEALVVAGMGFSAAEALPAVLFVDVAYISVRE